jgi:hypothetical protein
VSEITAGHEMYTKDMPKRTCIYCEHPEHFGLMPTPPIPFKQVEESGLDTVIRYQHWHYETEECANDKKQPKRIRCQKDVS